MGQLLSAECHKQQSTPWEWRIKEINEKLAGENENLRAENKDYKLLRKAFGSKQMDSLLEQAKAAQKSKQRGKHFKNNKEER